MGTVNGMHVENTRVGDGAEDRNEIVGSDGCVTMLHLQAAQGYPQIRHDLGAGVLIHVRMYTPNWWAQRPDRWAEESFGILSSIPGLLDDPNVILTAANEPDLAYEGHPAAATPESPFPTMAVWREIWTWSLKFVQRWRQIAGASRIKIGTTPVAGGHEPAGFPPDWEFKMDEFKALEEQCDAIVAHAYCPENFLGYTPGNGGYWGGIRPLRPVGWRERDGDIPIGGRGDPGGVVMQYPHSIFLVSEFGNWNHDKADVATAQATINQYRSCYAAYSATGRCLGITPFIWNSGDEHKQNRIFGNQFLIDGLKRLERFPASGWDAQTETRRWFLPLTEITVTQAFGGDHKAVDLRAPTGTPVYAVADGKVSELSGANYGTFFVHELYNGDYAIGAHLLRVTKTGDVRAGEQIAIADNTGEKTTGDHLHFEIRDRLQGRYDPMVYLGERGAAYPEAIPQSYVERYPEEYAAWVAAGGVEDNFKRHIQAIRDDIQITGSDVQNAVEGARSAAEQATIIAGRYKFID